MMDAEDAAISPGVDDGDSDPVVLILTQQQAEALAALITAVKATNHGSTSCATICSHRILRCAPNPSSPAAAVFAAAQAVVAGTQTDMAAEREARDVAEAVATTEKSVLRAALMTAQAASTERERKADAADSAAQKSGRHRSTDCSRHPDPADAWLPGLPAPRPRPRRSSPHPSPPVATPKPSARRFGWRRPSMRPRSPPPRRPPWQQQRSPRR